MAKPNSQYDELARDAAERIHEAKASGQQLTFLPDEPQPGEGARAVRGKGKATSQLRDWLAARGYRMPEDVISDMAGMASTEDAMLTAMAAAERMLAWARDGAATEDKWVNSEGETKVRHLRTEPTMAERVEAFKFFYTVQLRAAEALMPYGLGKVQADEAPQAPATPIVVAGGTVIVPQRPGDQARDVTPQARRIAPPPMPHEIVQNQHVAEPAQRGADDGARTE